jgi:membrane protease subunit (stomatin/prohibitin family)
MALWDMIRGQFIDVIEWLDPTRDTMVYRFPRGDNEIKNGAQLIVREGQAVVFVHEGEIGDVFRPGRYELTTRNIPVLTTLRSWKYAFNAPFKCEAYFVSTRQFTDLKWGTQNPIPLRDPEFGPMRLRAFGTYCIRCADPALFIRQVVGTDGLFETAEITAQLRNMAVTRFADALAEARIPALDLAANYNEIGDRLLARLQPEFQAYGLELTKFLVENISLPPEVEQALDQRSKLGILGNMATYTQMKTAEAIGDMAKNPGGGPMGMIAGMGLGGVVTGAMQAGMQQAAGGAAPPPLVGAAYYTAAGGRQAGPFDLAALQAQVAAGALRRDTLVWRQGLANWVAAEQTPELASLFAGPPPIPPTPPPPRA